MRTPMRRMRSGSCARAPSGHAAAAPPSRVMKSRRFIVSRCHGMARPIRLVCRAFRVSRRGRQVLGADLNCSESRRKPALKCLQQTRIAHGKRLYGDCRGEAAPNDALLDFTCSCEEEAVAYVDSITSGER